MHISRLILRRFLFALCGMFVVQAAWAASDTVQVSLKSQSGDWVGGGQNYYFDNFDGSMNVYVEQTAADGHPSYVFVYFLGSQLGTFAELDFSTAEINTSLQPGVYANAQRAPFASSGHPGIDVAMNGRGCNTDTGTFTVVDAAYDGAKILRLDLTFEQHCEGGTPALFGEVRINEPSVLLSSVLPGSRSVQVGATPTVFGTMVNTSNTAYTNCRVRAPGGAVTLDYQTTDPTTNTPTGTPDQPVILPGNGSQTFVLSLSSTSAQTIVAMPIEFLCDGTSPAPVSPGVNTLDLSFSTAPTTDVIAISATASGDGTVLLPLFQGGQGAFAVSSVNLGAAGRMLVTADTGDASLPLQLQLCQTDPNDGHCLGPTASSIAADYHEGSELTFSVFLTANGGIPFDPATNRVFVRFEDASGAEHGSTSVAVHAN